MTKMVNFRTMIRNLTNGFSAEKSCEQENYRNLLNGGFNYSMRSRTIM